ncbi:hypothetical protein C8A05DRAFT_32393 [Staphylotrichum tortipilum]|uniref:Uncharacterized protein n=1 Tax=Staphylotrichum tortipilum TaxID=2831512 RepID=A0AAN6MMX3_9PEZI|nr:hypothetical protein C8A05DRAFT_32393 [Staphylotrichum longicolle]
MGAVFAGEYQRPFFPRERGDEDAGRWRREVVGLMDKAGERAGRRRFCLDCEERCGCWQRIGITPVRREYLQRFALYDLNDELGGQGAVLGPFVEWFMGTAIERYRAGPQPASRDPWREEIWAIHEAEPCTELPGPHLIDGWPRGGGQTEAFAGGTRAEGESVLWEVMQAVHMFEFLLLCVANSDGLAGLGRPGYRNVGSFPGRTRTVRVVLFGVFQAEELVMPGNVADAANQELLAQRPQPSPGSPDPAGEAAGDLRHQLPPSLNIPLVLEDMYLRSGISNVSRGRHIPPPPLQVFTFMFRHHFNSAFHHFSFTTSGRVGEGQTYHDFKTRATIFSNGPGEGAAGRSWFDYTNGMEMLVEYQAPSYSYVSEDWGWGNPRTWEPIEWDPEE